MTINEQAVAEHYGSGGLLDRIMTGLEASGVDVDHIKPDDLKPVEEFHIGGREATIYATQKMELSPDSYVLDVGCGIGGAARYLAGTMGCPVMGIDLTPEYIEVARILTEKTGMSDKLTFEVASALDLPSEPETFDAVMTFHVAMNIQDRPKLYSETARVMKPGAIFCVYDVMKKSDNPITYPTPWAAGEGTSHLTTADEMETLLTDAGFEILETEDLTEFGLEFFKKGKAAAADGPPPLGIHTVMGEGGPPRLKNVSTAVETGAISPVQIISRRR